MSRIYKSQFLDLKGNTWTAEITLHGSYTGRVEDFAFDLDAATVEWASTELHEPIIGSAVTLNVISPGDRTFIDLYAAAPGDVTLTLYRNALPYWYGTLDPEFYEEPFDTLDNYEVSLTFSDFGALDRIPNDLARGTNTTIANLIEKALRAACIDGDVVEAHGLRSTQGVPLGLDAISVQNDNFYNEDGEPSTWYEVLEGALQPLGLRIVQIPGGSVKVFDLHSQRAQTPRAIQWEGTGHRLGTGKVYNDISVTFSPYGTSEAISSSVNDDDLTGTPSREYTFHKTNDPDTYESFLLQLGLSYTGTYPVLTDSRRACFYRTRKLFSGEDGCGILSKACAPSGAQTTVFGGTPWAFHKSSTGAYDNISKIFEAGTCVLHAGSSTSKDRLKISLEAFIDSRVNPFEQAEEANEKGDYERQEKKWNLVYIPVRIYIVADDGTTCHWNNEKMRSHDSNAMVGVGLVSPYPTDGDWLTGVGSWGECWLAYYDWNDMYKKTACSGWMSNRQCRGRFTRLDEAYQKRGDGEFIPMPPVSGTLHIEVGNGFGMVSGDDDFIADNLGNSGREFIPARWMMYRSASATLTDVYGRVLENEDAVYKGTISTTARNPLRIDTICGSKENAPATSRGLYLVGGAPMDKISRGALTDTPERLLIAAIASQYDRRHTALSGEVATSAIDPTEVFTEQAHSPEMRFAMTSCRYNVREACADATFIELSPQGYTPVK